MTDIKPRYRSLHSLSLAAVLHGPGLTAVVLLGMQGHEVFAQAGKFTYTGDGRCMQCHNEALRADPQANLDDELDREFCALDESLTFRKDKHRLAWEMLLGERAQRMQEILAPHWKKDHPGETGYQVKTAPECLSCHSGTNTDPNVYEKGVSCESCHGAASNWWTEHLEVKWRLIAPGVKESTYNFLDVRNPIRRAEQCFSCHIGNSKEGKVVTHEMYAAGHPPLPGIEIETFISEMPSHWRGIREKGEFRHRNAYLKANFPGFTPLDLPRTKSVMVGGVMALHESIELLTEQSANSAWPELAVFDCTACHHDLRSPSWRQTRGYSGLIPGRPGPFEWPGALIKLAINHRAGGDVEKSTSEWTAFTEKKAELIAALNSQPFGNSDGLEAAAASLQPWLRKLANDVAMSRVEQPQAELAITQLLSLGPRDYPDYHSARQVLWAYRTIQSELTTPYPALKPAPAGEESLKAAQDRGYENLQLFIAWQKGPQLDGRKRVDDLLTKLQVYDAMKLKLPATVDNKISEALPLNLEAAGAYDPDWFREKLQMLAAEE